MERGGVSDGHGDSGDDDELGIYFVGVVPGDWGRYGRVTMVMLVFAIIRCAHERAGGAVSILSHLALIQQKSWHHM